MLFFAFKITELNFFFLKSNFNKNVAKSIVKYWANALRPFNPISINASNSFTNGLVGWLHSQFGEPFGFGVRFPPPPLKEAYDENKSLMYCTYMKDEFQTFEAAALFKLKKIFFRKNILDFSFAFKSSYFLIYLTVILNFSEIFSG